MRSVYSQMFWDVSHHVHFASWGTLWFGFKLDKLQSSFGTSTNSQTKSKKKNRRKLEISGISREQLTKVKT